MPKMDLVFRSAILNAEGMLGFAPDARHTPGFTELGAFITNPVSLIPRTPAESRSAIAYQGGVLLHSGHPNPGLTRVLRQYARLWSVSPMPIILHLMVDDLNQLERCLRILDDADCVSGIELSFKPGTASGEIQRMLLAANNEWPVIAQMSGEDMEKVLPLPGNEGLTAISLPPERGLLFHESASGKPAPVQGRLYGAAQFPQALLQLSRALQWGMPVIAAGGVSRQDQVQTLLQAGALAVKLDTAFWKVGFSFPG